MPALMRGRLTTSGLQFVMTQVFAAINHRLSEEYSRIELPTLEAKERCALILTPVCSLRSRTHPLQFTHRRALPSREIHRSQNGRRTDRPPRDARRGQACHLRARLPAADDPHATLSSAVTLQQRSARCGRACGLPRSNEATLALLERAHQGHALAQRHHGSAARPASRTIRAAGAGKTRCWWIQAGSRASLADAADSKRRIVV